MQNVTVEQFRQNLSEEDEREMVELAIKALRHYQETGLHTTHEEMKEWVESFKTTTPNNRKPMPKCHK